MRAVIRAGREYLRLFRRAARVSQSPCRCPMRWPRQNSEAEEFALYDQLLRELAAKASGVPIGVGGGERAAVRRHESAVRPALDCAGAQFQFHEPDERLRRTRRDRRPLRPNTSRCWIKYLSRLASLATGPWMRCASIAPRSTAIRMIRGSTSAWPRFSNRTAWRATWRDVYTRARSRSSPTAPGITNSPAGICARSRRAALEKISREAVAVFSGTRAWSATSRRRAIRPIPTPCSIGS